MSNFDYYQPEAYMPKTDTYIEKNAMTNDELDMLRIGGDQFGAERRDTIIVASVACIYAASDPNQYRDMFFTIRVGDHMDRNDLLHKLVDRQYKRNDMDRQRGTFRVRGDVIEINMGHTDAVMLRVEMFDDEIERICEVDPLTGNADQRLHGIQLLPGQRLWPRPKEQIERACREIEEVLDARLKSVDAQAAGGEAAAGTARAAMIWKRCGNSASVRY